VTAQRHPDQYRLGRARDEQALVQALQQGLIAGAGFDVLTNEPPKQGTRCSNCGCRTSF